MLVNRHLRLVRIDNFRDDEGGGAVDHDGQGAEGGGCFGFIGALKHEDRAGKIGLQPYGGDRARRPEFSYALDLSLEERRYVLRVCRYNKVFHVLSPSVLIGLRGSTYARSRG
jgi:hypothetical protein